MKDKIHFAVIGQGHIGKRHAEMIRRNPSAKLVAVCDIQDKHTLGLQDISEPFYSDYIEMLEKEPSIDVVNICTPNGLHATQAIDCLSYKKHVVVEKPLALKTAEAEQIIFTALKYHKQVFCVMQNRYSPPSAWLKEIVDKKIIGDVYIVQLNCYWNRDERYYTGKNWKGTQHLDGGTLFTQFSHWIDLLYWIFGDIKNIRGTFADFNHSQLTDFEDSGLIQFEFVNHQGIGCINYSTAVWDKNMESSITVIGSKGSVKIGGQYMDKVEYCHIKDYKMPNLSPTNPANDYGPYKGSANNHHYIIENVIKTLKGQHTATTNALEGLKVVNIIERIYELRPPHLLKYKTTTQHIPK